MVLEKRAAKSLFVRKQRLWLHTHRLLERKKRYNSGDATQTAFSHGLLEITEQGLKYVASDMMNMLCKAVDSLLASEFDGQENMEHVEDRRDKATASV